MAKELSTSEQIEKLDRDIDLVQRSINEKWVPIWRGNKPDDGTDDCPLCQAYGRPCNGCPISEDVNRRECRGTPYVNDWNQVAGITCFANTLEAQKAAFKEIVYLQDLLAKLSKRKDGLIQQQKEEEEAREKVYYPHVFYLALKEPLDGFNARLDLRDKLRSLLESEGVKVKDVRYQWHNNHLSFDPETGNWYLSSTPLRGE